MGASSSSPKVSRRSSGSNLASGSDPNFLDAMSFSALNSKYTITDVKLGLGSFSVVKMCKEKSTDESFAVKIIERSPLTSGKSSVAASRLEQEVSLWRQCSHPNIVQFRDVYAQSSHLYIVMDVAAGGELFEKISQHDHFCERLSARLIRSLLEGVRYLHGLSIVHRDIKPENLLLQSPDLLLDGSRDTSLRICDFGIASLSSPHVALREVLGSPGYLAPEILLCRRPQAPGYGTPVDCWSAGVVLYIMLCGFPPFHGDSDEDSYRLTEAAQLPQPPFWDQLTPAARGLVQGLLQPDPAARLSAEAALSSPWLRDIDSLPSHDHCAFHPEHRALPRETGLLLLDSPLPEPIP